MNVPDRLKQLMDERNLTMYALAKASGVHWQTIKNLFSRTSNPTVAAMTCICRGLGITMSQFFLEEDEAAAMLTEGTEPVTSPSRRCLRQKGKPSATY